jgi:Ni/Co efflux regulator RcnB
VLVVSIAAGITSVAMSQTDSQQEMNVTSHNNKHRYDDERRGKREGDRVDSRGYQSESIGAAKGWAGDE